MSTHSITTAVEWHAGCLPDCDTNVIIVTVDHQPARLHFNREEIGKWHQGW